jgi:16S rRNA (cytidine1402-2'-O)-methyltransferase
MPTLFIVSTPIGNLQDISPRAIETLRNVHTILAEDTRHTRHLLSHFGIHTPALSFHAHSDAGRLQHVLNILANSDVALVSDAGTPGISDPGERLIQEAIKHGVRVSPVPGASAMVLALIACGFPIEQFVFLGFLPRKPGEQKRLIAEHLQRHCPLVVYEAAPRLVKTLRQLEEELRSCELCVAREMTKKFEEFVRGDYNTVIAQLANRTLKGEITLVINPTQPTHGPRQRPDRAPKKHR